MLKQNAAQEDAHLQAYFNFLSSNNPIFSEIDTWLNSRHRGGDNTQRSAVGHALRQLIPLVVDQR
jgi:hypothetical protein